jgi:hypothetical protein
LVFALAHGRIKRPDSLSGPHLQTATFVHTLGEPRRRWLSAPPAAKPSHASQARTFDIPKAWRETWWRADLLENTFQFCIIKTSGNLI